MPGILALDRHRVEAISAVRVPRTTAVLHPALSARPGRRARADDPQLADGALADLLGEPGQQARRQQPQLGRPGGRVGAHGEDALDEVDRRAVLGDLRPDDLRPPTDDGTDGDVADPAALRDELVELVAEQL